MANTIFLNLERCILLNDVRRMENGQSPIKSIHRLSLLIETRYDLNYDIIKDQMYRLQKKGYSQPEKVENLDVLIDKICEVLGATREDLVNEVER